MKENPLKFSNLKEELKIYKKISQFTVIAFKINILKLKEFLIGDN